MKVLFLLRHNFYSSPGGAQIQIEKTAFYLRQIGVEIDFSLNFPKNINKYDIIHLTDLTWIYDNPSYLRKIERSNFKGSIVLSTIYWPFDDYFESGAPFLHKLLYSLFGVDGFERIKSMGKLFNQRKMIYLNGLLTNYTYQQKKIIEKIDLLLPNSYMEMNALNTRLSLNQDNYRVIYNAIDIELFNKVIDNSKVKKDNNLICFVARIDPRKNQLNFLKAIYNEPYRIRFIGAPGPNSKGYFKELKALADKRGNVEFISHIPQEEVITHMLESKLHVLTSWIETPGLVSLEAAYCGCNILVSDKGSVREYFRDFAHYCIPDDLENIRIMTKKGMEAEFNPEFRKLIETEFSWEKTAKDTYESYQRLSRNK